MDEANARSGADPAELWRQWNDTIAKAWTQALDNTKKVYSDAYGLYPSWFKTADNVQEKTANTLFSNTRELWQTWLNSTMEIWQQAARMDGPSSGLATQWLKVMEDAQARLKNGETLPTDPFTLFRNWYNETSEQWSKVIEEMLASDRFLQSMGTLLGSHISILKAFRNASEEYFQKLQFPTRTDVTHVAELVVALEEKVDTLKDELETFEQITQDLASAEMIEGLRGRVQQTVTGEELQRVQSSLEQIATAESVERLEQRLGVLEQAATTASVERLEQRLNHVEDKLDAILSRLEQTTLPAPASTPEKETARPKRARQRQEKEEQPNA